MNDMTQITTTEILAIRILDRIQKRYCFNLQECYSIWAETQIRQGIRSDNLNILMSMNTFDNFFEVESYFLKSLEDLNIKLPTEAQAINNYAIFICKNIINNEILPADGCHILSEICIGLGYNKKYLSWYELEDWYELEEKKTLFSLELYNKEIKDEALRFLLLNKSVG